MNDQQVCIRVSARQGNREAESCVQVFKAWAAVNPDAEVVRTGPMGYDDLEPMVLIDKPDAPAVWYSGITAGKAAQLVAGWLENDDPGAELAVGVSGDSAFRGIPPLSSLPLFKLQKRSVLRRCGLVDPMCIGDSRTVTEAYDGFIKALNLRPDEVLDILGEPGLRGLDGAGDAVQTSWKAFHDVYSDDKVIVCRAFDNDTDAHLAQLLLEGDPHGVLEGILIAVYAMRATRAIIALPRRAGEIRFTLDNALIRMREYIRTSDVVIESGFSCDVEVREVSDILVMNEKTALLRCLEGLQAIPYLPAKGGDTLRGAPAFVFGIEMLAAFPPRLVTGRDDPPGADTKILTLTGDLPHPYTIEVPQGTTLRELVRDIGGLDDVKAVQFGGPTSIWSSPNFLDKTVSAETAREAGAVFGLSLVNVASNASGMPEKMESLMRFLHSESCGKCVFCREGTLHLHQLLVEILRGIGGADTLPLMSELGLKMRSNCICAFGRTTANPFLSSLELFREEFERRIKQQT